MKSTKISLKDLVLKHLREAEEKPAEGDKEGGEEGGEEENPFAAAEEGGDDAEAEKGEEKGEEEGGDKPDSKKPAGIPLKFNLSKVKQYNDAKFLSDTGTVKSIDKRGIIVTTQPDGVDVLVNFSDIENISESIKKFFKNKK